MNVNVDKDFDDGSYDFFFSVVDGDTCLSSMLRYTMSEQQAREIYEQLKLWFGKEDEPETGEQAEQEEPRVRGVYVTADRNLFLKLDDDGDWRQCLNKQWKPGIIFGRWSTVMSCLPASAFPLTMAEFHPEYDEPDDRCAHFLGDGRIITPGSNGVWYVDGNDITWDEVLMRTSPSDFPLRKAVPEEVES